MADQPFKFSKRSAQKRASREEDAARLSAQEGSGQELREENIFVKGSGFGAKKIGFSSKYPSDRGDKYHHP